MSDDPRDPTLENVLSSLLDAALGSVFGAMPGIVVSYNAATRRAVVQPGIMETYELEDGTPASRALPEIHDVPVMGVGTALLRIKFPIGKGDPVIMIGCGASIAQWKARGGVVDPQDDRRHDTNDVIAIPGLADASSVGEASALIEFTTDGLIKAGGSEPLVLRSEFLAHTHVTAATGPAVPPTVGTSSTPATVFPGTTKLRG